MDDLLPADLLTEITHRLELEQWCLWSITSNKNAHEPWCYIKELQLPDIVGYEPEAFPSLAFLKRSEKFTSLQRLSSDSSTLNVDQRVTNFFKAVVPKLMHLCLDQVTTVSDDSIVMSILRWVEPKKIQVLKLPGLICWPSDLLNAPSEEVIFPNLEELKVTCEDPVNFLSKVSSTFPSLKHLDLECQSSPSSDFLQVREAFFSFIKTTKLQSFRFDTKPSEDSFLLKDFKEHESLAVELARFASLTNIKPENLSIDNLSLLEAFSRIFPPESLLKSFRQLGKDRLASTEARGNLLLQLWNCPPEAKRGALQTLVEEWKEGSNKSRTELAALLKLILQLQSYDNALITAEIIESGFVNELLSTYFDCNEEYPSLDVINSLIRRDPLGNNFIISILQSPSASMASKRNAMYSLMTCANYHDPEVLEQLVNECKIDLLWSLPWRPEIPMALHLLTNATSWGSVGLTLLDVCIAQGMRISDEELADQIFDKSYDAYDDENVIPRLAKLLAPFTIEVSGRFRIKHGHRAQDLEALWAADSKKE